MTQASDYVEKVNALDPTDHPTDVLDGWYGDDGCDHRIVEDRELVSEHRWYNVLRTVFQCDDGSHFAVTWKDPATEMQEGQDPHAKAFLVEPREVTVTKYVSIAQPGGCNDYCH